MYTQGDMEDFPNSVPNGNGDPHDRQVNSMVHDRYIEHHLVSIGSWIINWLMWLKQCQKPPMWEW